MAALTVAMLQEALGPGAGEVRLSPRDEVSCQLPAGDLVAVADRLGGLGAEPQLVVATDTRDASGDFTMHYVFAPPATRPRAVVRVSVRADDPRIPSLAPRSFAAGLFEREAHDLHGIVPVGHPDPRRLALHQFWPEDYHPLRRDTVPRTDFVDAGQPFPFRPVEGPGIFEITVGPVHAGIIEPGHFRFSVEGETIVNLEIRLGFVHRGVEKLFETLPFERTWELAERISGDSTVAHALAYCEALEALGGAEVPERGRWLRVLALELERLYNHVGDVGMIVNDTGFSFGHAHCFRLRERLLRLNEAAGGHRLLRGTVVPGGVAGPLTEADLKRLARSVERVAAEFAEVARLCLDNMLVLERLQGTGRLTTRTAREMQVVGLVGRASGIDADARRDAPFAAYAALPVRPVALGAGDVLARTRVRIDEVAESARLVATAVEGMPAGPARADLPALRAGGAALGVVEGWRGPIWCLVVADGPRRLRRVKVADPSFRNWPALGHAVLNNIVPDFPLCNKSFNLSYAGSDL